MDPTNEVLRHTMKIRTGKVIPIENIDLHFYSTYTRHLKQTCLNCGQFFYSKKDQKQPSQFCCYECYEEYRRKNSMKYDPSMTKPDGVNRLSSDEAHIQKLLGRYLQPGDYVYRFGEGPDDIRILTKSDKGKISHNENNKYVLVDDGNYLAHVEFNPNNPEVYRCEECGNLFYTGNKRPTTKPRKYCSPECMREAIAKKIISSPVSNHSKANTTLLKHHLAVQSQLGRPLKLGELVYHKDKNILNNSSDNLLVFHTGNDLATWDQVGPLGSKLVQLKDGSYVAIRLKQIVDIEKR